MASTADFRNGMVIMYKDNLYEIVEFLHVKPGKGGAFVRTKLKNVKTGQVIDNTFRSGEKVEEVRVEKKKMEYLYNDGMHYVVMNPDTYEQVEINEDLFGDKKYLIKENMEIALIQTDDEIIDIELPTTVNLKVVECEPGVKGNTATNVTKSAKLESGLEVQVPLFINKGDVLKIDTRTNQYIERV
ncbi:MAG TPA: elongation factor P [Candidatus Cloacimonetes bacterium]|nr:elongation factor P [Candidatus Cloacimonadota bacterium]HEX37978.1 elongation factor P [Candidatus Cloacimonadota bacterium]